MRIDVVAALIIKQETVLIARRRSSYDRDPNGGLWEFPGGKVEPGETKEAALKREINEELGIEIEVKEPLSSSKIGSLSSAGEARTIIIHPYVCRIISGSPIAFDHSELKWLNIKDLLSFELVPGDIPIAQSLMSKKANKY